MKAKKSKAKNVKTKKYPKYWLCNNDGKPGVFMDCDCVKQTSRYCLFTVKGREGSPFPHWTFTTRRNDWIEVSPQEIVLILGYLP